MTVKTLYLQVQYVILDCTLKLHNHIICSKATSRMYFFKQLCRNRVKEADLYIFYAITIRLVVDYACPAWHSSLTIARAIYQS
jgi:hypothetical protein